MHIYLYFFGKNSEITPREKELIRRIGFRSSLHIIPLPQYGKKETAHVIKEKEADIFLNKYQPNIPLVIFDEHGEDLHSQEFSQYLKHSLIHNTSIQFLIGGAYGISSTLLQKADKKIRFGRMTWTKELAKNMTLEQIYRALEIDAGSAFHKE